MINAIVAFDKNYAIGSNNNLLTHIPDDLKNFKKLTKNNVVIMGRKTYDSLPSKPLPNRVNIIISSNVDEDLTFEVKEDNSIFVRLEDTKKMLDFYSKHSALFDFDIYIIGGGMIYKELLSYCKKVYATKINRTYKNADTYFPNIDDMSEWESTMTSENRYYKDIEYQFCIYRKKEIQDE